MDGNSQIVCAECAYKILLCACTYVNTGCMRKLCLRIGGRDNTALSFVVLNLTLAITLAGQSGTREVFTYLKISCATEKVRACAGVCASVFVCQCLTHLYESHVHM